MAGFDDAVNSTLHAGGGVENLGQVIETVKALLPEPHIVGFIT